MKQFVRELKDRDDFDDRISLKNCVICKGEAYIPEFRIHGQRDWELASKNTQILCKNCADRKELEQVLKKNETYLHQQLVHRFESEYWYIPQDLQKDSIQTFNIQNNSSLLNAKRAAIDFVNTFIKTPEMKQNLLFMGRQEPVRHT